MITTCTWHYKTFRRVVKNSRILFLKLLTKCSKYSISVRSNFESPDPSPNVFISICKMNDKLLQTTIFLFKKKNYNCKKNCKKVHTFLQEKSYNTVHGVWVTWVHKPAVTLHILSIIFHQDFIIKFFIE